MLAVEKGGGRNHLPQAVTGACCPPPVLAVGQEHIPLSASVPTVTVPCGTTGTGLIPAWGRCLVLCWWGGARGKGRHGVSYSFSSPRLPPEKLWCEAAWC